jgi:hypothetical protein
MRELGREREPAPPHDRLETCWIRRVREGYVACPRCGQRHRDRAGRVVRRQIVGRLRWKSPKSQTRPAIENLESPRFYGLTARLPALYWTNPDIFQELVPRVTGVELDL